MKNNLVKTGVTAFFPLAVFALSFSHAYAETIKVNCDKGKQTIQKALDSVTPGVPTTILITGVCNENVTITPNDITLQGLDPASSQIIGVPELDPEEESPITIHGAQRIIIDNLTVAGAESSGIVVITAVATVRNSVIENNAFSGIFVGPGAWVRIDQNTIQGNRDGIRVAQGGFGEITNNMIQNNSREGIRLRDSASAFIGLSLVFISGPNTIQLNKRNGILLTDGASALIQDNLISLNNTDGQGFGGIGLVRGASANLRGGNTVSQNTGTGIGMNQGVLHVRLRLPSTTQNVIELNTNDGISASNGSSIRIRSDTIIKDNGDDGIFANNGSSVEMLGGEIKNNGDDGIFANLGSSIWMSGGTINNNDDDGIFAQNGSSVEMRGGTINNNGDDGILALNGDGILALNGSSVEMRGGTIKDNDGRGINLADTSNLRIFSGTMAAFVQNNLGNGIRVSRDSGVIFRDPPATVSGNGVFDLACTGSESSFAGNTSGVTSIDLVGCTGF